MALTFIIIGIIIGGTLTLLSIVFLTISLVKKKTKNAVIWGIAFLISMLLVVFSLQQMSNRAVNKVETGLEWVKEHGNDMTASSYNDDQQAQRKYWLDTLQAYNMDKYDGKVPPDFYLNKPAKKDPNGFITIPFIYPYLIRYNTVTNTGDLFMGETDSIFVSNISKIAFDNNFALIEIDNSQFPGLLKKDHAMTEYLLYDMRTRNYEPAENMEKLLDLGRRIGYTGSSQLNFLSEDYKGWIGYAEHN